MHRQPSFSHRFHRFGFFGEDGFDDQQVIIIQQQPAPTAEPSVPAENKIYVQPHWVDGGYGVQVLVPGYWMTPEESRRALIRWISGRHLPIVVPNVHLWSGLNGEAKNALDKRLILTRLQSEKTMRQRKIIRTTLGDLIVAVTDEVMPIIRDRSARSMVVSYILGDLLTHQRVRVHKRSRRKWPGHFAEETIQEKWDRGPVKTLSIVGLGILLLVQSAWVAAGVPGDQVRQTADKLLAILTDPQLKGESKKTERREKLKEVIYQRFDFTEMAKRSLGSEWQRRSPEEQKEFVKLFTDLLERAYLDQIESYNGEKFQYLKEREDNNYAQVDTKIIDNKGREFSVSYRLLNRNGDWKVYDVVIEDISLVNNYRSQFNRVLAKSPYEQLVKTMKEKTFSVGSPKS
jgi:phospholipid transport system substrate-binding protein